MMLGNRDERKVEKDAKRKERIYGLQWEDGELRRKQGINRRYYSRLRGREGENEKMIGKEEGCKEGRKEARSNER